MGGVDTEDVFGDAVTGWISGQVEVRMVGHVDDRGSVRGGLIGNVDGIVLGEGVGHIGLDVAGEVVVTVR